MSAAERTVTVTIAAMNGEPMLDATGIGLLLGIDPADIAPDIPLPAQAGRGSESRHAGG